MKLSQGMKRMQVLAPPLPWDKPRVKAAADADVVVTLHGLWRSVWAMEPLAQSIHEHGFETVSIPYASFRYDLDAIVQQVSEALEPWIKSGRRIHFVTHSLGGVVVKRLLELTPVEKIGRVVMLAPPHKGSEIVDWLSNSPVRRVLGPAGEFLQSESMQNQSEQFPQGVEAAIIMGDKSALPFFKKLLDASNDGIVSVEKGRLLGIKEFKVVDADHTFIASDSGVLKMVSRFIKEGKLENQNS